jgi:hypothetical protein
MRSSLVIILATITSIQAHKFFRRTESCNAYLQQTCDNAGAQICCTVEGQSGTFASCNNAGDTYYVASCSSSADPFATCSQTDTEKVTCIPGTNNSNQ